MRRKPKATTTLRDILAANYRLAAVVIGRRFDQLGTTGQEDAMLACAAALDEGESVTIETWRLQDALSMTGAGRTLQPSSTWTVHPDGTYEPAGEPATIGADTVPEG